VKNSWRWEDWLCIERSDSGPLALSQEKEESLQSAYNQQSAWEHPDRIWMRPTILHAGSCATKLTRRIWFRKRTCAHSATSQVFEAAMSGPGC
jgi:hypothetical protein